MTSNKCICCSSVFNSLYRVDGEFWGVEHAYVCFKCLETIEIQATGRIEFWQIKQEDIDALNQLRTKLGFELDIIKPGQIFEVLVK